MMKEPTIKDLMTFLRQQEIRQTVGSDVAFNHFNNARNITKMRYLTALENGEDPDFVDALQSSPCPYPFVTESMNKGE